jgi:hypothetical protein
MARSDSAASYSGESVRPCLTSRRSCIKLPVGKGQELRQVLGCKLEGEEAPVNLLRRGRLRLVALLAVVAFAAASIAAQGATGAANSVQVSGTFTITDPGTTTCAANGAPFVLRCTTTGFTVQYSGSLIGTSVITFRQIINCKTSTILAAGTETFTGSIADVGSGSLTLEKTGNAGFDCLTGEISNFSAHGAITSGNGDLAGSNGNILFGPDTYSGQLH